MDFLIEFSSSIAAFIIVVSVIVSFHEFGHYLVAKLCGVKIDVFLLGLVKKFLGGVIRRAHVGRWLGCH